MPARSWRPHSSCRRDAKQAEFAPDQPADSEQPDLSIGCLIWLAGQRHCSRLVHQGPLDRLLHAPGRGTAAETRSRSQTPSQAFGRSQWDALLKLAPGLCGHDGVMVMKGSAALLRPLVREWGWPPLCGWQRLGEWELLFRASRAVRLGQSLKRELALDFSHRLVKSHSKSH